MAIKDPRLDKGPRLFHNVARGLKLRYQRIDGDIKYWQALHEVYLLGEHRKQFAAVVDRVDNKRTQKSLTAVQQDLDELRSKVAGSASKSPDSSAVLNTLQKLSLHLLDPNLESGFQVDWGYFRTAIEQRMVPSYRYFLSKVDIMARDCYYPLLIAIEGLTGKKLDKNGGWLSPMSVLRSVEFYRTISSRYSPVPYIFIPFDRMDNVGNLCAIHHEVGHDFFHKLNFFQSEDNPPTGAESSDENNKPPTVAERFRQNVEANMNGAPQIISPKTYLGWLEELFADMVGVMLAGPEYVYSLQEVLVDKNVTTFILPDYPSTYLRILLSIVFAKEMLKYETDATHLLARWLAAFPDQATTGKPEATGRAWETLFKEAVQAVVNQIKKNEQEQQKIKKSIFNHFKNIVSAPETAAELTADTMQRWLSDFVRACWEAGLLPSYDSHEINLKQIYAKIERLEWVELNIGLNLEEQLRIPQPLTEAERARLRERIEEMIKDAVTQLQNKELAQCSPRYLAAVAHQAFAADWTRDDQKLRVFLESLQERPLVANKFKNLEDAFKVEYQQEIQPPPTPAPAPPLLDWSAERVPEFIKEASKYDLSAGPIEKIAAQEQIILKR